MKERIIIGIDPDADRDGFAILHVKDNTPVVQARLTSFGQTLKNILLTSLEAHTRNADFVVVVEAGWLNKGNYHLRPGDNLRIAAAKGVAQGRNHQRGIDIVDYCQYNRIPVKAVLPLAKTVKGLHLWSGKDGKISQAEIENLLGHPLRVADKNGRPCMPNQEARDAVLLAWNEAGLPVKLKRTKL